MACVGQVSQQPVQRKGCLSGPQSRPTLRGLQAQFFHTADIHSGRGASQTSVMACRLALALAALLILTAVAGQAPAPAAPCVVSASGDTNCELVVAG